MSFKGEFAFILSILFPGTGHIYAGKTLKGLLLMIVPIIGFFVLIVPHIVDNIQFHWSTEQYTVLLIAWIVVWIFGIVDIRKTTDGE